MAVEAKLFDWKSGIKQAIRYKEFSNKVYVAIEETQLEKVDRDTFRRENIGLMTVSKSGVKEIIRPKKEKVEKLDIQYYMTDKF